MVTLCASALFWSIAIFNVVEGFGRTILHEVAAMRDWITDDEVAAFGCTAVEAGARTHRSDGILESTP